MLVWEGSASASPIVVVGAGGHAKVAIDLLRLLDWKVIACTDRDPTPRNVLAVPVIGDDTELPGLQAAGVRCAFVALGDNHARRNAAERLIAQGFELPSIVSPSAILSSSARVGIGAAILPGAIVCADAAVQPFAIVNTAASVDHDSLICDYSHVGPGCALAGHVRVGKRALVGVGCTIAPGVLIGDDAVIGAGSVVLRDIAAGSTAFGNPALVR